jgi:hypothetical protein
VNAADDAAIRQAMVHLHERILGMTENPDSPEIERTWKLFTGVLQDAKQKKGIEPREIYHCRQGAEAADPLYTVRAWRAVATYLLRRQEFLYE